MKYRVVCALLLAMFAFLPFAARADDEEDARERGHDAGRVEGRVLFIDRAHGEMTVRSASSRYDIMVLPSTMIEQRGGAFHTIADIRRGQRVEVFLSRRGAMLFAQIIRLHDER
jgi:hypothetical protein